MFRNLVLAVALALFASCAIATAQDNNAQSNTAIDQQSAPAPAQSQDRGGRGGRHFDPATRTQRLAKHLKLSSDQQSKVKEILTSEQSQMQQLRGDSSLSQQDRRPKMMEIHKSSNDQIRALLNPDQQQKWDKMQERHEQRMQKRHKDGQSPNAAPDSGEQQPQST